MKSKKPILETRWQRIQQILTAAAKESSADYGGLGPFWNLPLERLKQFSLYGVPLLSPVSDQEESTCCCSLSPSPKEKPDSTSTLGQRSGLVKGLRGQAPFDNTKFPRLPWGGEPVAASDIQLISDWIDDGCPENDHILETLEISGLKQENSFVPIAKDQASDARSLVASAETCRDEGERNSGLKQRMNLDCLSDDQIDEVRHAFREMYELNKWPLDRRNYNNLALIHQNHCQHGWERFLPWHRIYLYEFELAMQDFCPKVTMPYWDWTMPQYRPEEPEKGWIIPKSFQSFLTRDSIENLKKAFPPFDPEVADKLLELVGKLFVSPHKFFSAVQDLIGEKYVTGQYRNRLTDELLATNALWYPLRYPAEYASNGVPSTINKVIHYHYPSATDMAQIQSLRTFRDYGGGGYYNDSFGFLDQNPHNTMHIWTGGMNPDVPATPKAPENRNRSVKIAGRRFHSRDDLYSFPDFGDMFSNLTASYDPIFWPLHSNLDRLWWEWQQMNPNSQPGGLDGVLTPWSYTLRDTLDIHQFGYEYVRSSFVFHVGLEAPVSRFTSRRLEVPEITRKHFRQAEVRLHRVPQLPRSCFIRVFLNLPDADSQTELTHENYAGYASIFGHGTCYGGPGHCDLPPERARKFDHRPRSHNAPRNMRINVSEAARTLFQKGATHLQITIVVIGADYTEEKELLRLDHVSLTFLD